MKKIISLVLVLMFVLVGMSFAEEKKTLTLGTNVAFPPYEYYDDETGLPTGIDVDIAQAVCDMLGYELVIEDIDFDSIFPGVASGKYDLSFGGLTITEERKQSVAFSEPYAEGIQVIIVPEDSELTLDALYEGGYTIGVVMGYTGDMYCTSDFGDTGLDTVERYKLGADAVLALTSGKIDCVIIDSEPAKKFVEVNEGLKILETAYTVEEYAACFALDNTELVDEFNTALAQLKADGTIDAIIAKYIHD